MNLRLEEDSLSVGKGALWGKKKNKYTNQTIILISLISMVSILPMFFLGTSFMVMILSFTLTDSYLWILSGRVLSILRLTEGPDN